MSSSNQKKNKSRTYALLVILFTGLAVMRISSSTLELAIGGAMVVFSFVYPLL